MTPENNEHRIPGPASDSAERPSAFTTRAQRAFRRGSMRRLAGACLVAAVALVVLVLLGPSRDEIKERFEYYGAPGEMKIMPEIAIDDGQDQVRQLPKSLQAPPPPAHIEVDKENPSPDGTEPAPQDADQNETIISNADQPHPDAETFDRNQVELTLPRQSNPDWYILHEVRPEYPFDIPDAERRRPLIIVKVAIFVGADGLVTDAMIQGTDGSPPFAREVLEKVKQWRFGWRVDPGAGRWIEMIWNFKSPYSRGNVSGQ